MVPAAAFATDKTSTWYDLPEASQKKSFQHKATDNGQEYTFEYVTIGQSGAQFVQPFYEILGLNFVCGSRGTSSIFNSGTTTPSKDALRTDYMSGDIGSLKTRDATLAIVGMDNNENPDEYIYNYCVWANGGSVTASEMGGNNNALTVTVGTSEEANFPRQIYTECNIIAAENGTAEVNGKKWSEWVTLENSRSDRPKTGSYNPVFTTYSAGGGSGAAKNVAALHTLADKVDTIIASKKDGNGNHPLQSRYGGNTDNGTGAAIDKYEDLVQATQYYTLSKIEDGTVQKKVSAMLVGYDPATGNYACRRYNTDKDPDGNNYGGRVANYLASTTNSITELGLVEAQQAYNDTQSAYVAWYTPEQIVNNADVAFVCDAPSTNNVSGYLAAASDGKAYTVYSPARADSYTEGTDYTKTITAAKAAQNSNIDICFSYPANQFNNFYAQGIENGMLALIVNSFTYPELGWNLTDMLGYWARYVWHVDSTKVQTIVEATASEMNLSGDTQIGTVSTNYEETAQKIFDAGNEFYIKHRADVDKINGGNLKTYKLSSLIARTPGMNIDDVDSGASLTASVATVAEKTAQTVSGTTSYEKNDTDAAFSLDAKTDGDGKLSYTSSNEKVATVDASGKVTIVGAGATTITVTAAATDAYKAATLNIAVNVVAKAAIDAANQAADSAKKEADAAKQEAASAKQEAATAKQEAATAKQEAASAKAEAAKKDQTITVKTKSKTYKVSKLKSKKQSFSIGAKASGKGTLSYKVTSKDSKKKITFSKGKVTVKKGTKKGTYKVKVKISANAKGNYKAASKTFTIKVVVKK